MTSIAGFHSFYPDLWIKLSADLSIADHVTCARVCKVWKTIFDSDAIWKRHANELGIEKEQSKTFIKIVASKFLAICPNTIKKRFQRSFKQLVKERYDLEGWSEIQKNYPPEFLKIFGTVQKISKIPKLEIHEDELGSEHEWCHSRIAIDRSYFVFPLRFIIVKTHFDRVYILLIRSRDMKMEKKFNDAIAFRSLRGERFFSVVHDRQGCSAFNPGNLTVTREKIQWISRVVEGKPVLCNSLDPVDAQQSFKNAVILDSA